MPYNNRYEHSARKSFLTGLAIIAACAVLVSVSLREPVSAKADTVNGQTSYAEPYTVAADTLGIMYILRSVDGRVAVLNPLETAVLEIIDITVSALPEPYADELEGGVIICSVTELVNVLSEYKSFT